MQICNKNQLLLAHYIYIYIYIKWYYFLYINTVINYLDAI